MPNAPEWEIIAEETMCPVIRFQIKKKKNRCVLMLQPSLGEDLCGINKI
jgi:hypothetical protein